LEDKEEENEKYTSLAGFESDEEKGFEKKISLKEEDEGPEEGEDRGEDPDYDKNVSDDEEDVLEDEEEIEEPPKRFGEDAEENEQAISEAGKEIQNLLKKKAKELDEDFSSSDDGESEDEEDDFRVDDLDMYKKVDSPPPLLSVKEEEEESKVEKRPRSPHDTSTVNPKKQRIEGETKYFGPPSEEEVRKALLLSGKTTTKALVKKFKSRLNDKTAKARFAQLVKKLGKIVEEHGEKLLILKEEYKYKDVKPQIHQVPR